MVGTCDIGKSAGPELIPEGFVTLDLAKARIDNHPPRRLQGLAGFRFHAGDQHRARRKHIAK
jgi:hypothetical protein